MCQEDDCRDCGGGCHCDKDEEIKELEAQLEEATLKLMTSVDIDLLEKLEAQLAEAKRDMREVTCDARETYEEMSKQLAEARERIEFLEDLVEAVAPDSSAYQDYINQYNL